MYKKLLPVALLFSSALYSQTAQDTLWVNTYDEVTTKALASSFKVSKPSKLKEGLKEITTYNKETKAIEVKGFGQYETSHSIVYDGKVTYFNADGSVNFYMFFEEGTATKITSIDPYTQEEYTLSYQEGYPFDGVMVQLYQNTYFYITMQEGSYQSYLYINKNNPVQKYTYTFDEENNIIEEQFLNESGEVLYTANYEEGLIESGTSIVLNYETFVPQVISTYVDGVNTATVYYTKQGDIKYKTLASATKTATTYYNNQGKEIGKYTADLDEYGSETNQEGTSFFYNTYGDTPDVAVSQSEYKKGELVKEITFHTVSEEFKPKSIMFYKGAYSIDKIEYFNLDGSKKGELTYDKEGYSPVNGILYDEESSITTYKDGVIVAKKAFYSTGELFEDTTALHSTYYDKKGNVLGKLQSKKGMYEYTEPFQGDYIALVNDAVGSKVSYDKGQAVYSATYEPYPSYDDKPILREETFTLSLGTSKRVHYSRQGKKTREELYNPNEYSYDYEQNILKVTYFDSKGKVTGHFDNIEKEGTYYTYFDNDVVKSKSTYSKGELVYKKEYANKNGEYSTEIIPYLISEIDYNKEGVFYDTEGNVTAKASYKNGQPYTGTVSANDGYSTTISSYEKGVKEGLETFKSDYADYVATKTYYENGEITKEEDFNEGYLQTSKLYTNGELDGETNFYDEEGNVLATLTYRDGYPQEGTYIAFGYESRVYTTYEEGVITYEKSVSLYSDTLKYEKTIQEDGSMQQSLYDEEGVLLYQYGLKDYSLHGSYTAFENGKVKYKGRFEEGRFVEGTVALRSWPEGYGSYGQDEASYVVYTLQKSSMTIQRLDIETNKVIFELTSKLKKGKMEDNPIIQSTIESSHLYPYHDTMSY